MPSVRCEINNAIVSEAMKEAEAGFNGIKDYADTKTPGLVLRVRGHGISWLIKNRAKSRNIGHPPKTGVRAARQLARQGLETLSRSAVVNETAAPAPLNGWTWQQTADAYIEYISNARFKNGELRYPSEHTVVDVKRAFNRPQLAEWSDIPACRLTQKHLLPVIRKVIEEVSYRQAQKVLSFVKAALTWALNNKSDISGLIEVTPWWPAARMPEPTGDDALRTAENQRPTAKSEFGLKELGILLARHEEFCRGKTGEFSISPGVRWGLWWIALTTNRGGAAMLLEVENIIWSSNLVPAGWAIVHWPALVMKTKQDFQLPISPLGVHILRCAARDWKKAATKSHGPQHKTKWVFASTRRMGRNPSTADPVVRSNSIITHLENMRGERQASHRNHLEGLPHFTLHSFRGTMATYLIDANQVAPGAASAILAHQIPRDEDPRAKLSATTKKFYARGQRIPLKQEGMEAWSSALLDAFEKAGGIYPD